MALSDDTEFQSDSTGPKLFTQYSLGAIMVLVAPIGSFLTSISQCSILFFFWILFQMLYPGFESLTYLSYILGPSMIFISMCQVYYAYQLHTRGLNENNKIIPLSALMVILEIGFLVVLFPTLDFLLILLFLQVSIGVIIFNIIPIVFLNQEKIQREFRWTSGAG